MMRIQLYESIVMSSVSMFSVLLMWEQGTEYPSSF